MSNEVETKIKTFVATEKVVAESWAKKYRGWIIAVAVALATGAILVKAFG